MKKDKELMRLKALAQSAVPIERYCRVEPVVSDLAQRNLKSSFQRPEVLATKSPKHFCFDLHFNLIILLVTN